MIGYFIGLVALGLVHWIGMRDGAKCRDIELRAKARRGEDIVAYLETLH